MSRINRFANNISVEVDIDIDDFLCEITSERLAAELKRRNQEVADSAKARVKTAIAEIRRGNYQDAITTLEREFFPKWQSSDASTQAYQQAMGASQ